MLWGAWQKMQIRFSESAIAYGHALILVDHPTAPEGATAEDEARLLRKHLDTHGYADVKISMARKSFMQATRLDPDNAWVRWAAESIRRTTGAACPARRCSRRHARARLTDTARVRATGALPDR